MDKSSFSIFKTFFKIGTMLLGGGYVVLPLLLNEISEKKGWVTSEELCEYYALSSSLPGVIAVNTAVFTGKKIAGTKGAVWAVFGMILPSFLAIVLLASVLGEIASLQSVKNIFWGVGIAVITLLFLAVKEMWKTCVTDKFTAFVYLFCLIAALSGKISPAWIIIIALIVGVYSARERRNG